MKINIIILIICILSVSCNSVEQSKMKEKATIVEMVLFKTNKGIKREEAQRAITELNEFVSKQKGFISRTTTVSEDDQFLDIIYWTDLQSAKTASGRAMKNPKTLETFKIMDESDMVFKYFSIFNKLEKYN